MDGIYFCYIFVSLGLQMPSISFRNADNNVHWQWHEHYHHQQQHQRQQRAYIAFETDGNSATNSSANKLLNSIVKCHAGATAFATTINSTQCECVGKMGNKRIVNVKICLFLVYFFLSFPLSLWPLASCFFSVSRMHTLVFLWRTTNIHQIALECNFQNE